MDQLESQGVRLLSFDGGDIRAVSQLILLDEIMRRVEWDRKSEDRILPCDYFHMIAGVGTGGLLAILLGILRMEIEDAIEEFIDIWRGVFADGNLDRVARAEKLETVMKELLKRKQISENQKLISEDAEGKDQVCKVFVCAAPASSLGLCEKFRSYRSRSSSTKPTIIEALRATCAIPALFSPVSIKVMGCRVPYVTGSHSFNNPAAETIKEATEHFGKSCPVACMISLGCGQRIIRAVDGGYGTNPADLIEAIASDCEVVHNDLSWRIGASDIYYRFCVGPNPQPTTDSSQDPAEEIVMHSKVHLGQVATMERVDQCVAVAERLGRSTLGDISGVSKPKSAAAHGLPSQSAFFVERPELIKKMSEHLFRIGPTAQRRLVLSGLGGVGKTQITISFLLKFLPRFRHVLFIDASSVQSIESGIVTKVNSLGSTYSRTTALEALEVLANPDHEITRDWAIVYDNVDDPNVKIGTYFPKSTFGTIIVTTRNPNLGNLAPSAHIKLDIMSEDAAVDVLLRSAIDPSREPTDEDKGHAREIVKALGYLPVALVQAGYFIKMHDCMPDYLRRLIKRRPQILNRPAEAQLDDHYHGIYATLDVTWPYLSTRTQSFLSILGFVNYTGFPIVLIYRAAKRGFLFEPFNFSEQAPQFYQSAQLLCEIFRPDENWDEQDVDDLVAELEQYSLVTRMTMFMVTTLRLHPLVHSWVHDRLNQQEQQKYQAAAVRLLVCGTGDDDDDIFEFIYPHVALLTDRLGTFHVNDRAGIAAIFTRQGDLATSIELWEGIHRDSAAALGEDDLCVSEIKLQLASVYWNSEDSAKHAMATQLESAALELRVRALGPDHLMTIIAYSQMVRGISRNKRQKRIALAALFSLGGILAKLPGKNWEVKLQAKEAQASALTFITGRSFHTWIELLRERIKRKGPDHHTTFRAAESLAAAYDAEVDGSQYSESSDISTDSGTAHGEDATEIWTVLLEARTKTRGPQHPDTLKAMEGLAWSYVFQSEAERSIEIWKEVIDLRKEAQGPSHKETLHAMEQLARTYVACAQYSDAEEQWREVITLRKEIHGLEDNRTVKAMAQLAMMHEREQRYEEAESHWKDIIAQMTEARGPSDQNTLYAMDGLAKMYSKSEQYKEAEEQWKAVVYRRKNALGSSHRDTMQAMIALGLVYAECQRYTDAEALWREVIAMSKEGDGSFGRLRIKAMESLAKMNQTCGQNEGAIEWWKETITLRREMQNRLQGETPNALDHLKLLYNTFSNCYTYADIEEEGYGEDESDSDSAFGDPEMTDALNKMMAPDNNEFFTPDSKGMLNAIYSLGEVYMECGRYEEAEALLATAVKQKIDGFDDDDSGINDMLENMLEKARDNLIPTLGIGTDAIGADREEDGPVSDEWDGHARKKSVRESVCELFPSVDIGVIDMVLDAQGGDKDATINVLLDMLVGD